MKIKNLEECETLAGEILRNIELSKIPINNVILKGLRLCRLMGDEINKGSQPFFCKLLI